MGIEHANPDTMAGLFSSFDDANWTDKTKLDDERLKNLIEHMSAARPANIGKGTNNRFGSLKAISRYFGRKPHIVDDTLLSSKVGCIP